MQHSNPCVAGIHRVDRFCSRSALLILCADNQILFWVEGVGHGVVSRLSMGLPFTDGLLLRTTSEKIRRTIYREGEFAFVIVFASFFGSRITLKSHSTF